MQDSQQKWDHTVHMAKLGAAALGHLPKSTWVWAKPPVLQRIRWISQKTLQRNLREKKHVSPAAAFLIIFAGTTFFQCHEQVLQIWMDGISNPSVWVAFETTCEKALPLKKTEAFGLNEILQPFHPSPMCSLFTFRSPAQLADGDFSQIAHPLKEKKMTLPLKWFWRFHYVFPKTISHHLTRMLSCSIWGQFLLWTTSATKVLGWMRHMALHNSTQTTVVNKSPSDHFRPLSSAKSINNHLH